MMNNNIQSMTGFARSENSLDNLQIIWEIRSVNHRHLDIHLKLPENARQLESEYRALISQHIKRGRIDASLQIKFTQNNNAQQINIAALKQLKAQLYQVESVLTDLATPNSLDVLMMPGILQNEETDVDKLQQKTNQVLQSALQSLTTTRFSEGQHLKQAVLSRLDKCRKHSETLKGNISQINQQIMDNYKSRIAQLNDNVDEQRLAQEFALMLTRADVSEELDRLDAHYTQITELLNDKGGAVGRRLDFLMQELNREANTLGSKANDIALTNCAVDLKVLIDQMREQIQNIE